MASGTKFIRVHGRVVPVRQGGGAGRTPAKKSSATPKQAAAKAAKKPAPGRMPTATRFVIGGLGVGMLALGAAHIHPFAKAAQSFAGAALANRGLKQAGAELLKRGQVGKAQALGGAFVHNERVKMAAKSLLKRTALSAAIGGLWLNAGRVWIKAAVRGGNGATKPKANKTKPRGSSV